MSSRVQPSAWAACRRGLSCPAVDRLAPALHAETEPWPGKRLSPACSPKKPNNYASEPAPTPLPKPSPFAHASSCAAVKATSRPRIALPPTWAVTPIRSASGNAWTACTTSLRPAPPHHAPNRSVLIHHRFLQDALIRLLRLVVGGLGLIALRRADA